MTASSTHPHGPADPRWITDDGRCLLCADSYHKRAIQEQAQTISHLTKRIEDLEHDATLPRVEEVQLIYKLDALTKRSEADAADCAAMREALEHIYEVSKEPTRFGRFLHESDRNIVFVAKQASSGATLLARLKSLEERNKELEIHVALWSSTFQKYQSWKANSPHSHPVLSAVVADYEKLSALKVSMEGGAR